MEWCGIAEDAQENIKKYKKHIVTLSQGISIASCSFLLNLHIES